MTDTTPTPGPEEGEEIMEAHIMLPVPVLRAVARAVATRLDDRVKYTPEHDRERGEDHLIDEANTTLYHLDYGIGPGKTKLEDWTAIASIALASIELLLEPLPDAEPDDFRVEEINDGVVSPDA